MCWLDKANYSLSLFVFFVIVRFLGSWDEELRRWCRFFVGFCFDSDSGFFFSAIILLFYFFYFNGSEWWSWRWMPRLTNACSFYALRLRSESKGKAGNAVFLLSPCFFVLVYLPVFVLTVLLFPLFVCVFPSTPSQFVLLLAFFFLFRFVLLLVRPPQLRPFSGFYKAREGLVSWPPEMASIVEARDHGFRNGIVGIVAVICWIFPCWTGLQQTDDEQ